MLSMGQRTADFLIHWRWQVIVVYLALTAFFSVGVVHIAHSFQAQTSVADLIPAHNRVTDVFKRYQSFSKPATVEILLKVKHGTIYTPQTLARIWRITRELDLVPGIDHVTLTSIASEKVRVIRPTPPGLSSEPVMTNKIPATQPEATAVQERARHAAGVTGILVSPDEKATLIEAAFFEHGLDYTGVFERVHKMLAAESDPDIEYYTAGRVMLIAWVYRYGRQALWIFLLSLALIILAHIDYMRSLAGALTPIIAAAVSTIWGLGAGGWLGLNLEPLTVVVPVLLMARALSHSLQITRRYYEILYETHERVAGAAGALASMFAPAFLGIMCDVAGLYMICLAPIPIIQKLGVLCGTWSLLIIPSAVLLTPVLLAILPPPRDVSVFITHEVPSLSTRLIEPVQRMLAGLLTPRMRIVTTVIAVPVAALMAFLAMSRPVGNVAIGSPLLWPNNEFNVAEREINANLAGTATLNVVWEGKIPRALYRPEVYGSMLRFQKAIERNHGAIATLSLADYIPYTGLILRGGNPKWLPIDLTGHDVGAYLFWTRTGHSLENFSNIIQPNGTNGDVVLWYKDLRASTVDEAMAQAERAIAEVQPHPSPTYRIRLATGAVALQYALDHVVRTAKSENPPLLARDHLRDVRVDVPFGRGGGDAPGAAVARAVRHRFRDVPARRRARRQYATGGGGRTRRWHRLWNLPAEPHLRGVPGCGRRRRTGRGDARGIYHRRGNFLRRFHDGAGRPALVLPIRVALPGRDGPDVGAGDGVQRSARDERAAAGDRAYPPQVPRPRETDGTQAVIG